MSLSDFTIPANGFPCFLRLCSQVVIKRAFFFLFIASVFLFGRVGTLGAEETPNDEGKTQDQEQPAFHSINRNPIKINMVRVGDPGNDPDDLEVSNTSNTPGYYPGKVDEEFLMGKTDVTVTQYAAMLNAVASKSDPYHLYVDEMNPDYKSKNLFTGKEEPNMTGNIVRTGKEGAWHYEVKYHAYKGQGRVLQSFDAGDLPITNVSWFMAARFCNWCHNGFPIGEEGPGTTETGAYALNGACDDFGDVLDESGNMTKEAPRDLTKVSEGARCYLPSYDQMHKVAFYKGGGKHAGYYKLPVVNKKDPPIIRKELKVSDGGTIDPTYVTNPEELAKYINNGPFALGSDHNANYFVISNYHLVYFNFKEDLNTLKKDFSDPQKSDELRNDLQGIIKTLERPGKVEDIYREMKSLVQDIHNPAKREILRRELENSKKMSLLEKTLKENRKLQEGGNCSFTKIWDDQFLNGGYWDYRYANGGFYPGTTPVGVYHNEGVYGTLDMAGNVAQWVNWPSGGSRVIFGASWKDGLPEMGKPLYQYNGNGGIVYDKVEIPGSGQSVSKPRIQKGDDGGDLYEMRLPMDHRFNATLPPDFKNDTIGFRIAAPVSSTKSQDSFGTLDILETSDLDPHK